MLFNKRVLENKVKFLDSILKNEVLLRKVLEDFSEGAEYEYKLVGRPWNPGGGSTLFSLRVAAQRYFLKVKSSNILVESKLESEKSFTDIAALKNEYFFLQKVKDISPNTPKFFEYAEKDDFGFLFTEYLSPFKDVINNLNSYELLEVYNQIEGTVRKLYERGILHTDIHENNIVFRGKVPVLIDFEEARELSQQTPFEESLDVTGENALGNVGLMPDWHGAVAGYTCLNRLKRVFAKLIISKLDVLVKECRFDSSCPFLRALDHGKDERIYQSIDIPGYHIEGQRSLLDNRSETILEVVDRLFKNPYTHLDIGSNLGRLNIDVAKSGKVKKSIGVEAYTRYVQLARILAFLSESSNVEFIEAECGKDSLVELLAGEDIDLVTIYSTYHHIENKQAFIKDLLGLNPSCVLFEMPVQRQCYDGRSWEEEISLIARQMDMPYRYLLSHSEDYKRPIVLISKKDVSKDLSTISDAALSTSPTGSPCASQDNPKVSVVLPTYNHLRFLPKAVKSLLSQEFKDFELIIVNDGSTDGTREYLDNLKEPRIRVIHQENRHLPEALNTGFQAARGELLTWISADNYCAPIFLEALVGALEAYPSAGFAYSAHAWIDDNDQITGVRKDQDVSCHRLFVSNVGIASFMYRRICHEKVGWYDPDLEGAEDWDMWLRILEQFQPVYVPDILYYYRIHKDSLTEKDKPKVFRASRQTFRNAIRRRNNEVDIAVLYPTLHMCRDLEAAKFYAYFDLGTSLLQSRFSPIELASRTLENALSIMPGSVEVVSNLAIAYAGSGQWEKVLPLLKKIMRKNPQNKQVLQICYIIVEAYKRNNPKLLSNIPLLVFDKKSIELFQLEQRQKNIFSSAHCNQDSSAEASRNEFAALNRAKEIDHQGEDSTVRIEGFSNEKKLHERDIIPAKSTIHKDARPVGHSEALGQTNKVRKIDEEAIEKCSLLSKQSETSPAPMVSVYIVTYNMERFIRQAIDSALAQTYQNLELLVVDDGSTDGTKQIVESYSDDRIRYIYKPHKNFASGMNMAISKAKGEYLIGVDSDDFIATDYIEKLLNCARRHPQIDYFYPAKLVLVDESGNPTGREWDHLDFSDNSALPAFLFGNGYSPIPNSPSLKRKSLFDKVGLYEELDTVEDFVFLSKNALTISFKKVEEHSMYFYRRLPESNCYKFKARNQITARALNDMVSMYPAEVLYPQIAGINDPALRDRQYYKYLMETFYKHVNGHMVRYGEYFQQYGDYYKEKLLNLIAKTDKAVSSVDGASAQDDLLSLFKQGVENLKEARPQDALVCFDKACRLGGKVSNLQYARAVALMQLGRCNDARLACEAELAVQPGHRGTQLLLNKISQDVRSIN